MSLLFPKGLCCRTQVVPGASNSACYDTATLLKMLMPLAALPADDPTLPIVISPLSTVLAAAAVNHISLTSTVRRLMWLNMFCTLAIYL